MPCVPQLSIPLAVRCPDFPGSHALLLDPVFIPPCPFFPSWKTNAVLSWAAVPVRL